MIDRYNINAIESKFGIITESNLDLSGEWIKYEDFKSFLVAQTCLDYFRTWDKAENWKVFTVKWLDENGTELMSLELNSIKEVKDAIVTINQRKNKEKNNEMGNN